MKSQIKPEASKNEMSKLLKLKKEFTLFLLRRRKGYETKFMLAFYFKFAALSTELCLLLIYELLCADHVFPKFLCSVQDTYRL